MINTTSKAQNKDNHMNKDTANTMIKDMNKAQNKDNHTSNTMNKDTSNTTIKDTSNTTIKDMNKKRNDLSKLTIEIIFYLKSLRRVKILLAINNETHKCYYNIN